MKRDPADTQRQIFDRAEEIEQLRQRLRQRQSFLFHGPAGVGKTLLLSAAPARIPDILYSPRIQRHKRCTEIWRNCFWQRAIQYSPSRVRNGLSSLQTKTAVSLKGLVRDALLNSKYLVVLDHLMRPSQALGGRDS